jgi:FSR family fosmidomycin resistance protein-like MFS transporter
MDKRKVYFNGLLHCLVDFYSGFFGIYWVIAELDPVKAALTSSVSIFLSNGLQPLTGYLSDRIRGKIPVFVGVLASAVFMSMIGITQSFLILFPLVLMSRLGSSVFHPAGSNIAGSVGLDRKEKSFAIFATMGYAGLAFSQPCFSAVTAYLGNMYSFVIAIPAAVVAVGYLLLSNMEIFGPQRKLNTKALKSILFLRIVPVLLLFVIMVFRRGFFFTLSFFVPKLFSDWGFSRFSYSIANTVLNMAGAAGILISGFVAHKTRPKTLMLVSLIGFFPFCIALLALGPSMRTVPTFVSLGLVGFMLQLSHVPYIIMGQRIFPEITSTISGILMGFAAAVGAFGQPITASCADLLRWAPGLASGIVILMIFPLCGALLTLFLPENS